jgi:hypothetical protein
MALISGVRVGFNERNEGDEGELLTRAAWVGMREGECMGRSDMG